MRIRFCRAGVRRHVLRNGVPTGEFAGSWFEVWKSFDDTAPIGSNELGPIYALDGYEVRFFGDAAERMEVRVQVAQETERTFSGDGAIAFSAKPSMLDRFGAVARREPVPRSLSDFTGAAFAADNTGAVELPNFTPTNGNLVIVSGSANTASGTPTGVNVSGAAALGLAQIDADVATTSGVATGFGGVWWGVGTGAEISDLDVNIEGTGANQRGSVVAIEAAGQHASPIEQFKTASGTGTSSSVTLDSVTNVEAIVGCTFRNGTAAITEGATYAGIYELSSAAGSNDFLNHVQFDRTSPANPATCSWTGSLAWDTIAAGIRQAAAVGNPWYYYAQM